MPQAYAVVWPKLESDQLEDTKTDSLKIATDTPIHDSDHMHNREGWLRALIIDDSAVMRKVIERALRQAGLELSEVLQASNGEEALQTLRENQGSSNPLALILSDINMPIMDGLQFLETRRQENLAQGVPVVMITTEGNESFVMRAIAAGAQGYICKPFTAEQVKARVLPLLAAA
jgi:two-component system, chemotaxis family, chemotaxis protein CheY